MTIAPPLAHLGHHPNWPNRPPHQPRLAQQPACARALPRVPLLYAKMTTQEIRFLYIKALTTEPASTVLF
jgi:hypothetical protein